MSKELEEGEVNEELERELEEGEVDEREEALENQLKMNTLLHGTLNPSGELTEEEQQDLNETEAFLSSHELGDNFVHTRTIRTSYIHDNDYISTG